jgi:hypothetical protein
MLGLEIDAGSTPRPKKRGFTARLALPHLHQAAFAPTYLTGPDG